MAPTSVDASNQETVWQRIYGGDAGRSKPKLRVGDRVRISKAKKRFRKGYMASWSEELFTVGGAHPFDPPVYRLIDDAGTILDGTFYEQELQKVIVSHDKLYRVEAVLQRRKKGKPESGNRLLCQVVILYTVIVVSIYNFTQGRRDSNLWTVHLSSCLGYLLPNPSMKRDGIARLLPDAA